jgi:ABC-2 type transport system ATP-binding protein
VATSTNITDEDIVSVANLEKKFAGFTLGPLNFSLRRGYITGFIGPNGAGKTTTIKLLMNLLHREGGAIRIFGQDNIGSELDVKRRIGFVYDESFLYEDLTVGRTARIFGPHYPTWNQTAFESYAKRFGLPLNKRVKDLSRGMKMKLNLSLALAHDPELLIMDEPTSGLDVVSRQELLDILSDFIQDENRAVLFSTHITSDLDKVADYVLFIREGQILLNTSKDEIFENYALVKGPIDELVPDLNSQLIGVRKSAYGFDGLTKNRTKVARLNLPRIVLERPTLEQVMLYFEEELK